MITIARQQSVFQQYHSEKYLSQFYPQDGGESQLASKLRHCRPMYNTRFPASLSQTVADAIQMYHASIKSNHNAVYDSLL